MIFFRLPYSEKIFTVEENSETSFVKFISFDEEKEIMFPGKIVEISKDEFLKKPIQTLDSRKKFIEFYPETEESYSKKIEKIIEFIKDKQLQKLVISRIKLLVYQKDLNKKSLKLNSSFLKLIDRYPNAFVYLFNKGGEIWMGAFSELLGKFNKKNSEFETMSLAGTLPVKETWSQKEIEEQKPVTDYIKEILSQFSSDIKISDTSDHISGDIKHLRTDFSAKINSEDIDQIISELHPTPAVCGIPKDFCRKAIRKFESYDRALYSGYSRIETEDEIFFFVNLRCAQFLNNAAYIYVGGGITAKSSAEKEWRETELKSQAIINNL